MRVHYHLIARREGQHAVLLGSLRRPGIPRQLPLPHGQQHGPASPAPSSRTARSPRVPGLDCVVCTSLSADSEPPAAAWRPEADAALFALPHRGHNGGRAAHGVFSCGRGGGRSERVRRGDGSCLGRESSSYLGRTSSCIFVCVDCRLTVQLLSDESTYATTLYGLNATSGAVIAAAPFADGSNIICEAKSPAQISRAPIVTPAARRHARL